MSQAEKELIIVCLGNSLADPEQSDIHPDIAKLYDKLRIKWGKHNDYHTAKEILDINGG